MDESPLLTTDEAASYLRVHPETLRNWVRRGQIPAAKLGNRGGYRLRRGDLDRFLAARSAQRADVRPMMTARVRGAAPRASRRQFIRSRSDP